MTLFYSCALFVAHTKHKLFAIAFLHTNNVCYVNLEQKLKKKLKIEKLYITSYIHEITTVKSTNALYE